MRYLLIGGVGLVLLATALAWTFLGGDGDTGVRGPAPVASAPTGQPGLQPPEPPPLGARPQPTQPVVAPQAAAPPQAEAPAPAPRKPVDPSFDVVRIKPNGDAVFAGRAEPGARVTILDGDKPIGSVAADSRGEWVYLPTEPLPAGGRELGLKSVLADGRTAESSAVVMLYVPERAKPEAPAQAAAARPAAGPVAGTAAGSVPAAAAPAAAAPAPAPPAGPAPAVVAVATPRAGDGPSRVLQAPQDAKQADPRTVTVEVVDYDAKGELILSGRGNPGSSVVIYLDNKSIGQATVDKDRQWEMRPQQPVDPGTYRMRADQVTPQGKVVGRVEMPFMRADAPPPSAEDAERVVVQPGNSLWRIARQRYGAGPRYTVIYAANRDQIRDPDLIYPGQIFATPSVN